MLTQPKHPNMPTITGRIQEIRLLKDCLASSEAELVAIYGRRRVGKTYLIRQVYEREMVFAVTGIKNASLGAQLENFTLTLAAAFQIPLTLEVPRTWLHAFRILIQLLETRKTSTPQVVFIDEFPWFDTPRSGFLAAFDHFWNSWASQQPLIKVVICGSAASWMIRNVVRNKGGLHNRITRRIRLMPFDLYETEQYLHSRGIRFDRFQLLQLFMVTGGIPHYLKEVQRGESVTQAIGRTCFTKDGLLREEFDHLYASLFDNAEKHIAIVKLLASKPSGLTRNELMAALRLNSGGTLTKTLSELQESGFIDAFPSFGKTTQQSLYKLMDEFSLFYLKYVEGSQPKGESAWLAKANSPSWVAWRGLAFERICLKHIPQIKRALGISSVYSEESTWRISPKDESQEGAQIDLVIDRMDRCINLVEIKFTEDTFLMAPAYAALLNRKRMMFTTHTQTRKTVFTTLLTTFGAATNDAYLNTVQSQINMDALFVPL